MFDYLSSTNFMDQILQRMEQTVKTSAVSDTILQCKETCINENKPIHEKLILKFTRCSLDVNENKIKWKVSIPEGLKNDKLKVNYNPCKTASADKDIIFTLDDIFNPLAQENRERMRRLKQEEMDQVLCINRPDNDCGSEIKRKENKYPSDELLKPCKSIPCLSNYKSSFKQYMNSMAGFRKDSRNNRKEENKINFYNIKMNKAIKCSIHEPQCISKHATMKRKSDSTSLKLQSGRESFEEGDLERPHKKRRVFKQQNKLNRKKRKCTSDLKCNQTDLTFKAKTRPNCINHGLRSSNRRSERLKKSSIVY